MLLLQLPHRLLRVCADKRQRAPTGKNFVQSKRRPPVHKRRCDHGLIINLSPSQLPAAAECRQLPMN